MTLADTFAEIRKSLSHRGAVRAFLPSTLRHRALAPYDAPLGVLAVLAPSSPLTVEERDAILVALLAELNSSKDTLWRSLLLVAFEPLIVRVRARLGHPRVVRFGRSTDEDLDQRVLLAFLEAAHSMRVISHAARMLRLSLERKISSEQRIERQAPEPAEFDDDKYWADPLAVSTREQAAACEVVRIIEAEGGADLREMMLATRANRESLRAYVARTHPEMTPREQSSLYRRLADAATKVERKLRTRARRDQRRLVSAA
jgi:hypothetical protein